MGEALTTSKGGGDSPAGNSPTPPGARGRCMKKTEKSSKRTPPIIYTFSKKTKMIFLSAIYTGSHEVGDRLSRDLYTELNRPKNQKLRTFLEVFVDNPIDWSVINNNMEKLKKKKTLTKILEAPARLVEVRQSLL